MPASRVRVVHRLLIAAVPAVVASAPAEAATMRAFVTSTTCNGDLGACTTQVGDAGVAAANNFCQLHAASAGLDTGGAVFRAWLSDSDTDAFCNVLGLSGQRFAAPPCGVATLPTSGPWMRLDAMPFIASLAALDSAGPIVPLRYDEDGTPLALPDFVLTGTTIAGTVQADSHCSGWTTADSGSAVSGGNTDVSGTSWAAGAGATCDFPGRLFCLEVGSGDPLAYPGQPGALAFVTSTSGSGDLASWAGSGGADGLAGGDNVCQARATAAQLPLPGSFVAFLSAGATDAASRLSLDGPWKRVDGVPIAGSLSDLTDGTLDEPIDFDEAGGRSQVNAWTGTTEAGLATGDDCEGWTSGFSVDAGTEGWPWRSENNWTGGATPGCDQPHHQFCFSNQLLLGWDSFESGDFLRWSAVTTGP